MANELCLARYGEFYVSAETEVCQWIRIFPSLMHTIYILEDLCNYVRPLLKIPVRF